MSDDTIPEAAVTAFTEAWEAEREKIGRGIAPKGTKTRAGLLAALPYLLGEVGGDNTETVEPTVIGHVLFRSQPGGGLEMWDGEIYPTQYEAASNTPPSAPNPGYAHNVRRGLLLEDPAIRILSTTPERSNEA